ncbi:EamA domain-containing membrane protein RarD [Paenibacillus sp. UNCCL117]|uniref:DMT family transporter n=1 Tax=unclassified Paenibacillus TaxID=185978 RepID=UPI000885BD46|nr:MULTISPECIES: EamA family transporter [unclassified Paenibacillus]SDC91480.1 EamA domain-containing membrane protein RarD [Paenibacillus sp. cl123]SFW29085.1 EamA domain-containing membrane protein RarD [Paenibacillus sp. UNCCL117]
MEKPPVFVYMELSLAAVIVGSSVVAGKLMSSSLPVFLSQSASLAVALLLLVPLTVIRRRLKLRISRKDVLILLLQAFLGMFLFRVLMLYGLKYASAAESGIMTSLTPAVVALLSFIVLKERPTPRLAGGVVCSLLGLLVLQLPNLLRQGPPAEAAASWLGAALVLSAVFGEAALTVLRKLLSDNVSSLLGTMYVTLFAFLMFLVFSFSEARAYDFAQLRSGDIGLVVYYGVFVTALAYVLWFRGVSRVPASTAAVFTACIPVSALLLSYGILREPFSYYAHIGGIALVLAGVLLISFSGRLVLQQEV